MGNHKSFFMRKEETMEYININKTYHYSFIPTPKSLLYQEPYKSKLSDGAKLTAIYMLDLVNLSKLNKYCDSFENIIIYCSKKNLEELFNITNKTAIKNFKELEELNVIKTIPQGKGKTYQIFFTSNLFTKCQLKKDMEFLPTTYGNMDNKPMENLHTNNRKNNIDNNIYKSEQQNLRKIKENCHLGDFEKIILKTGVSIGSLFNATIDTLFYSDTLTIDSQIISKRQIR